VAFDPEFAAQTYPDRDLRFAAFATDEGKALLAAQAWLEKVNLDQIVYSQHQMVTRLLIRHGAGLRGGPKIVRLMGIKRQLWTRANVNLGLLRPTLAALAGEAGYFRLVSGLLEIAAGRAVAADGLDVIDLLARQNRKVQIADALISTGWKMTPWLVENFEKAKIMHFTSGPTGRLRIFMRGAFAGLAPEEIFGAGQPIAIEGVPLMGLSRAQSFAIAVASASQNHVLAGNWLYDLANLRKSGALTAAALPMSIMDQGLAALSWANDEAGLD
jgi:hypothetical protein